VNIGFNYTVVRKISLRPGCIKRCQFVVKVNILSSDSDWGIFDIEFESANQMGEFPT
jgi:hypothetical protein